jgi:DNA-binding transcriptional MerR regulator
MATGLRGRLTLTIGQLAAYAGPERDASGYRRYEAQAVVDLIRIKTLAAAGVPLARVRELLDAPADRLSGAVAELDRELARRIEELAEQRRRMADLAAGERLFLPPDVVAILERERAYGHSERMIRLERDLWIMAAALSPEVIPDWVATKNQALDDPTFRRLYLACDHAMDWEPSDPRLVELADDIRAWDAARTRDAADPGLASLMNSHVVGASPAWQRLARYLA